MKIYTKGGDKGKTHMPSQIEGRVNKNHSSVIVVGELDELNAAIGYLGDQTHSSVGRPLWSIQAHLFEIGAQIATGKPRISEADILWLEKEIDEMEDSLPALTNFIYPRGTYAHIARATCRRAERAVVDWQLLSEQGACGKFCYELIVPYLNRLSDYLFVFARYVNKNCEQTWKSDKDTK